VADTQNSGKFRGLKPFQKGKSGNPGGRPKTADFAKQVRDFLGKRDGNRTNLETVLQTLKDNKPEILLYYGFGKPAETVTHQNPDGSNLIPQELISAAATVAKSL
jgi:hypothetical protein